MRVSLKYRCCSTLPSKAATSAAAAARSDAKHWGGEIRVPLRLLLSFSQHTESLRDGEKMCTWQCAICWVKLFFFGTHKHRQTIRCARWGQKRLLIQWGAFLQSRNEMNSSLEAVMNSWLHDDLRWIQVTLCSSTTFKRKGFKSHPYHPLIYYKYGHFLSKINKPVIF